MAAASGMNSIRQYGLIGYPLSQSFSQQYFSQKFAEAGLDDYRYDLFPIADIHSFPGLLQRHPNLKGFNITIPYKEKILAFLQHRDAVVAHCGACNCVAIRNGALWGYNTDVVGFEQSLLPGLQSHHQKALVLGTGGASKAVQYVLEKLGIPFLLISRQPANGSEGYAAITAALLQEYTLVINTTPLGMYPAVEGFPTLPYDALGARHYLYDLVYNPPMTLFLQKGAAAGAQTKNGYEMLVLQAEENWRIWSAASGPG